MALENMIALGTFPYMAPELYKIILNDFEADGCVILLLWLPLLCR